MTVRLIILSPARCSDCCSSHAGRLSLQDLELLVLRQELVVLRRQVPHPKNVSGGTACAHDSPTAPPARERMSNLFTPDTLRRWHRELVKAKWHFPHRVVSRGREFPSKTQVLVWRISRESEQVGLQANPGRAPKYAEHYNRHLPLAKPLRLRQVTPTACTFNEPTS